MRATRKKAQEKELKERKEKQMEKEVERIKKGKRRSSNKLQRLDKGPNINKLAIDLPASSQVQKTDTQKKEGEGG